MMIKRKQKTLEATQKITEIEELKSNLIKLEEIKRNLNSLRGTTSEELRCADMARMYVTKLINMTATRECQTAADIIDLVDEAYKQKRKPKKATK